MIKKILYVVVGALVLAALIALLWLWIAPKQQSQTDTGAFGSSDDRAGGTSVGVGSATNLGSSVGQDSRSTGSSAGSRTDASVTSGVRGTDNLVIGFGSSGIGGIDGVSWVNSAVGGNLSGSGRIFTPSEINQLTGANGSLPFLAGGSGTGSAGGLGLGGALLGAGIAGAVSCGSFLLSDAVGFISPTAVAKVQINDASDNSKKVLDCLTRVIARVALDQITRSIVQWINSGFNGKPSFVQDYNKFFTNVADQAAGEFIRGSGLAFLCSPFRPQVRIAIAKAYANRGAQSCSLTSVIRNVNSFMSGNFSSGGWPGFLSFTTMPTNNPYGSYVDAQIRLGNYQADKLLEQGRRLAGGGGFLSVVKQQDCTPRPIAGTQGALAYECKEVVVTPGRVVADSVSKLTGNSVDSLNLAKNFDEIIGALIQQLMVRTLYSGLTGVDNSIGIDPAQQAAYAQAQSLLNELQATVNLAQQYGAVKQGAINDIQQVQSNYNTVYNCWSGVPTQTAQTSDGAATAQAQIDSLQLHIDLLNASITAANSSIARIQDLQTELALASNAAGVQAVANSLAVAKASGVFLTQNDVALALQDRQTLQAEMQTLTVQANSQLSQCRTL